MWQMTYGFMAAHHSRFENRDPGSRPYDDLREFAHVDPDGNLMRVGSPLKGQR
jgi:hypothetical protein